MTSPAKSVCGAICWELHSTGQKDQWLLNAVVLPYIQAIIFKAKDTVFLTPHCRKLGPLRYPLRINSNKYKEWFFKFGPQFKFLGPDLDSWYITYHDMYDARLNARGVNIDRLSFNGKRMYVSGTDFDQPKPSMPRYSTVALGLLVKASE